MSNISLKRLIEKNYALQSINQIVDNLKSNINNFKQKTSQNFTDFKKSAAPRLVALMLAGTTVASMASCDKIGGVEHGELYKEASQVEIIDGVTLDDINSENYRDYINEIRALYPYGAVPYKFLTDNDVLIYDDNGSIQYDKDKDFQTYIMIDEKSAENDIRVFISYLDVNSRELDSDNIKCVWELKYILDEQDYKDLLLLSANGDIRMTEFIQGMEKKYDYEILSKNVSGAGLDLCGVNWIKTKGGTVLINVESVNNSTGEVKMRALKCYNNYVKEVIYTLHMKEGPLWEYRINKGYTEEEILNGLFTVLDTPLGKGYDFNYKLDVFGIEGCLHSQSGSAPYESINEYKLIQDGSNLNKFYENNNMNYDKAIKELEKGYQEGREKASQYYKDIELEQ